MNKFQIGGGSESVLRLFRTACWEEYLRVSGRKEEEYEDIA
jgi:hypothetical protein